MTLNPINYSKTSKGSHLGRLQSTLGLHQSSYDIRKIDCASPSKPIVPELILETIWSENNLNKFVENKTSTNVCFFILQTFI